MRLQQLVRETLVKNGLGIEYSSQIVASLIVAGFNREVPSSEKARVQAIVTSKARMMQKRINPLAITAALLPSLTPGTCPYCNKPMRRVSIAGDDVHEALFCMDDRIVLPLPN